MQDAMDMGADAEGEADDVYEQILGEIGMDMQGKVAWPRPAPTVGPETSS